MTKIRNNKLKIAFLASHIIGPKTRTQFQRSYYLSKQHELHIFVKSTVCEEVARQAKAVHICPGQFLHINSLIFPFWAVISVLWINRKERFEIVYTTYDSLCIITGFLLQRCGFLWVSDIWDDLRLTSAVYSEFTQPFIRIKRLYNNIICRLACTALKSSDLIIIALHPDILKLYKINTDSSKVLHVTNGIDPNIWDDVVYNLNDRCDDKFKIVYVGDLTKLSGINILLSAMQEVKQKAPEVVLFLIGRIYNNENWNWLIDKIDRNGVKNNVTVFGELPHEEVIKEIKNADLCVFPFPKRRGLDYIYPIKLFEYMVFGKAIVATRLKGTCNIIQDGYNGLLVQPDDPMKMAEGIMHLYLDCDLRKLLSKNAKESAKKYNWHTINSRINEKLLDSLRIKNGEL